MSKIQMTTLTPVHIGSGNLLQYNTEFIQTKMDGLPYISILDERKILELIGEEHLNDWVLCIERKDDIVKMVQHYSRQSDVNIFSKRLISLYSKVESNDTLKEHIHNGFGVPYIPGSSIKGAVRTAILATLANRKPPYTRKEAYGLEKALFGQNPYTDIFRFLQVGDAHFDNNAEIVLRLMMFLNITKNSLKGVGKSQLVEAIGANKKSLFSFKISNKHYNLAKRHTMGDMPMPAMPDEMKSVNTLFQLINEHTKALIEQEISIWEDETEFKDGAENYIDMARKMLASIERCKDGECVLRMGHAIGWRFITGAWTESLSEKDFDIIAHEARRKKLSDTTYNEYIFPKSRRAESSGFLLGFVKLKILE